MTVIVRPARSRPVVIASQGTPISGQPLSGWAAILILIIILLIIGAIVYLRMTEPVELEYDYGYGNSYIIL